MELILVRHPEVAVAAGTCYGQADVPLRLPMRPAVAELLGPLLDAGPVCRVVSSPLQRAQRPAQALAEALGCPLSTDPRWMELAFGDWEGRRWDLIPRHESDPWAEQPEHRAPPGGETLLQLRERVHAAMDALLEARPALQRTLVLCHAGPIRVARARALGVPLREALAHPLPFGGSVVLRAQRAGSLWQWEAAA